MKLRGVFVGTARPEKLSDFYRQLLQQEPAISSKEWIGFNLDGRELSVSSELEDRERGGVVMVIEVENAAEEYERVKAIAPVSTSSLRSADGLTIFLVEDPDGNTVEIFTETPVIS